MEPVGDEKWPMHHNTGARRGMFEDMVPSAVTKAYLHFGVMVTLDPPQELCRTSRMAL